MSARDPPNLRRWEEWGVKKAGKQGSDVDLLKLTVTVGGIWQQ